MHRDFAGSGASASEWFNKKKEGGLTDEQLIKQQINCLFVKSPVRNEMFSLVNEYLVRGRLAKIGYMASDLEKLDSEKAQLFVMISTALENAQSDFEQKARKKASRGTR